MAIVNQNLGTHTAFVTTSLNTLASSATAGWKSAMVDNTGILALDYELNITLPTANTAPANDKAVYIYLYGGYYDGSAWHYTDGGTATIINGTEGAYTIASPNDLILFKVLNYTTQQMILKMGGQFIARAFGGRMPDAWGLVIVNFTGAAFVATNLQVAYKSYMETIA